MLVSFTVDPDVFSPTCDLDELQRHKALLHLWEKLGQIVIPACNEAESRLFRKLQTAPQKVQIPWRHGLKRFCKRNANESLDEVIMADAKPTVSIQSAEVKLVSLERARGSKWGLSESLYSMHIDGDIEICRFGHESSTNVFSNAISLSNKPITSSDTPDKVWVERIRDFAKPARNIVVSDRYAMKNFLESRNREDKSKEISGIERLLIKLADLPAPSPRIVTLYSALEVKGNKDAQMTAFEAAGNVLSDFASSLFGVNFREVKLNIADDSEFGALKHYRYIRFDDKQILLLDTGLEPLSGTSITRTCPVSLAPWRHSSSEAYRKDEKAVQELMAFNRHISW